MYDITKPLDIHVHIVGNGSRKSGCTLAGGGPIHSLLYAYMERHVGLPAGAMKGDLDHVFSAHLARLMSKSSLGGAAVFAQDNVYNSAGRRMKSRGTYYVPNEFVFKVCRRYPQLLPVCSIHPARPDAIDELDRCIELGAVMMKLLPNCHNVNCNDPKYRRFWQRMADAKLPLLNHTGGENTLDVVNAKYSDPSTMTLPLECGVTLIAAHCAGKSGIGDPEYFDDLLRLMQKFPNLYTDQSALNLPIRSRLFSRLFDDLISSRLVHGSDYPVPVTGLWVWLRGMIDWETYRRLQRIPNVIERDYQIKRALGFSEDVFLRGWKLLRLPKDNKFIREK